jgi:DNA-binding transcriptional LysR family regulator
LSVGDEQHFGRAATRLALSQPSLSVQIKQLEAHIGARIFDRHSRRVRFTDAGRVMGVSYQSRQQYVLELSSTGR